MRSYYCSTVALFRSSDVFDPGFVEGDIFHGLALGNEVAVDGVDGGVASLNDRRIVIRARWMMLQMPADRPGATLVLGEGQRQAVAVIGRVVVDQQPVAIGQRTPSMPAPGLGRSSAPKGPQVRPSSLDSLVRIF